MRSRSSFMTCRYGAVFRKFMEIAIEKCYCMLCGRYVGNELSLEKFMERIIEKLEKFPSSSACGYLAVPVLSSNRCQKPHALQKHLVHHLGWVLARMHRTAVVLILTTAKSMRRKPSSTSSCMLLAANVFGAWITMRGNPVSISIASLAA